jgi:hypothetical protein
MGEDSVRATRPHPSEQQSQSAERRSVQKKCEKSGLAFSGSYGGFIGRKSDGKPGWQTIWKDYKRLQDMLAGALLGCVC